MNRGCSVLGAVSLGLLLSGCALLGGGTKPLDTFALSAPSAVEGPRSGRLQILITEPSALRALDGENIVITPGPGEIEYLGGAQWADRLPRIVQARLAEGFQRSNRFGGVGLPGEGLAIDYQVVTDIRRFQIDVARGNVASVELFVRLLNDRTGTVRAERSFVATAPLGSGAGNAAYVQGLNNAFDRVGQEIIAWVAGSV